MDHEGVVRQKMTERYLLGELDDQARQQFEEHYFDCSDCAQDVRAAALFVEQSKVVLAEAPQAAPARSAVTGRATAKSGWLAWFRPAFAVPVMALLLAVIGYQNLVMYPRVERAVNSPRVLPFASVNIGTFGAGGPVISTRSGEGFLLFVRIPPESSYTKYVAQLYNPAGKPEWSLTIPASAVPDRPVQDRPVQDQWPVQVPAATREAGTYSLVVNGVTAGGESKEVGRSSFELQIQQ
jgi:hypothetical protein